MDSFVTNSNRAAQLLFQAEILNTEDPPVYQRIREKAPRLQTLGLTNSQIAVIVRPARTNDRWGPSVDNGCRFIHCGPVRERSTFWTIAIG